MKRSFLYLFFGVFIFGNLFFYLNNYNKINYNQDKSKIYANEIYNKNNNFNYKNETLFYLKKENNYKSFLLKYYSHLNSTEIDEIVHCVLTCSKTYNIDFYLLASLIMVESNYQINSSSNTNAKGLTQLTSITIQEIENKTKYIIENPYDIEQNITGASIYLSLLKNEFKDDKLVLAAYNAGPTIVRQLNAIPNYSETINYVKKIEDKKEKIKALI